MDTWIIRTGAGAALLALAVAGCGGSGTSQTSPAAPQPTASEPTASAPAANGVAAMGASQATRAALAALTSAPSVHVAGTFSAAGRTEHFDMRFAGNSAADGSFTANGAPVQMVTCDGAMYLKAGQDGWSAMGDPAGTAGMMADRWFKVGSAQAPGTTPLSLAFFTGELTAHATMTGATVTRGTLAGRQVAIIAYPDGSRLYVAAAGPAYPLRFDVTGGTGGDRDFSDYGAAVHIAAPSDATDLSNG